MRVAPRLLLVLGLGAALAGCTVGPNYLRPETLAPDLWHQQLTRGLAEGEADLQTWWTLLEDPILVDLVERASKSNLDISQAVARVDQARGERGVARGFLFPTVNNRGEYQRARLSEEVFQGLPQAGANNNFYSFGFEGSWEIDVFGRVRRSVESASAGLEAEIEDYRDVLVAVFAEVALAYVDARTFQARIDFAERNAASQRGTLQLVIDRNRAGLVGDLDVRQAEQNLAQTEAAIPPLRQGLALAIHRLGVLIGAPPSTLYPELSEVQPIPEPPDQVMMGVPAESLRQRPDVRAAERRIAEQNAQIGVAKADLYPRFSISGNFRFDALSTAGMFTGNSQAFGIGPTMTWNLFDGGRVRNNIYIQEAVTEEALKRYELTVLEAYEDVENSMVAFVQEQDRRDALERAVVASAAAVELVQTLYRTGLTDFQNVLDTERTLFIQQDDFAESRGRVTQNLIQIYRALGGGWSPTP